MTESIPLDKRAESLIQIFTSTSPLLRKEFTVRRRAVAGQDVNMEVFLDKVASLFVTATEGQEIQYAAATVRKDPGVYEFVALTDLALAYCSASPEPQQIIGKPTIRLIPRSELRSLKVASGVALGGTFTSVDESAVLLNVDYGEDVPVRTLPLDPEASYDSNVERPTALDRLVLSLVPGLLRDLAASR